jgi:hypothetical protein
MDMTAKCTMDVDGTRIGSIERIVRDWLDEPELLVLAGRWADGAVMELVPTSPPLLTAQRYEGRFAGLRDLLLNGQAHHVHLDLGRLNCATYLVCPSVCFGFRPSFELRLHASDADPLDRFGLGFSLRTPYRNGRIARAAVGRYFARYRRHRAAFARAVSFVSLCPPLHACALPDGFDWSEVGRLALDDDASHCRSAAHLAQLLHQPAEILS